MTEQNQKAFISAAIWASALISCGTFLVGLLDPAGPRVNVVAFVWVLISVIGLGSWLDFSGSKGRK